METFEDLSIVFLHGATFAGVIFLESMKNCSDDISPVCGESMEEGQILSHFLVWFMPRLITYLAPEKKNVCTKERKYNLMG